VSVGELFPIDYRVWADYWDLLEHHGLNAENTRLLAGFLASPILILGSGQGLLSHYLAQAGYDVCGVDRSTEMATRAKYRRGMSTVVCDALQLHLRQRFRTIIVSTGVVNDQLLGRGQLPRLIRKVEGHLLPGGYLILGYFRISPWTLVAQELELYGRPSRNVLFWKAQGDLAHAERLFAAGVERSQAVHRAFDVHATKLSCHMDSILAIGKRHIDLGHQSPEQFIGNHSGYYPFPLPRQAESLVFRTLEAERMSQLAVIPMNDGDTRVLVCERIER
jgi:SAM-dependent methyltransferase